MESTWIRTVKEDFGNGKALNFRHGYAGNMNIIYEAGAKMQQMERTRKLSGKEFTAAT